MLYTDADKIRLTNDNIIESKKHTYENIKAKTTT